MGVCQSKSSAREVSDESIYDELDRSIHETAKKQTQRQKLASHHDEVDIHDVYDIVEVIGQGSMGEVTIVTKKNTALSLINKRIGSYENLAPSAHGETNNISHPPSPPSKTNDSTSTPTPQTQITPSSSRKYACKTVNTTRMKPNEMAEFINEINILRDLDHPNIVQLFEVYKVKRKIWIVTELCRGGDLSARADGMTEEDVAAVLEQILRAIHYMHKRNVCHRDIKLENIMYADTSSDSEVKLIDFGLSNKFTKGKKMQSACGTIYTAAPELLSGEGYTEQTDIWSIGVIAWILLSQSYPFMRVMNDLRDNDKVEKLKNARLEFGPTWKQRKISKYGREFVSRCMKKHSYQRWMAAEALDFVKKEWVPHLEEVAATVAADSPITDSERTTSSAMTNLTDGSEHKSETIPDGPRPKLTRTISQMKKRTRMDTATVEGMQKFGLHGELKKTILMTMAYTMDKSSLHELRDMFAVLDVESTGTITLAELKEALAKMHSDKHLDDETIEKLFRGIDIDNSGEIHYTEFLAAVSESQGLITHEALAEAFDRIDADGKGYISRDDLRKVLGMNYKEELVSRMIDEADFKKNGQIDYDEFLRLMFEEDPAAGLDTIGGSLPPLETVQEDMVQKFGHLAGTGLNSSMKSLNSSAKELSQ